MNAYRRETVEARRVARIIEARRDRDKYQRSPIEYQPETLTPADVHERMTRLLKHITLEAIHKMNMGTLSMRKEGRIYYVATHELPTAEQLAETPEARRIVRYVKSAIEAMPQHGYIRRELVKVMREAYGNDIQTT